MANKEFGCSSRSGNRILLRRGGRFSLASPQAPLAKQGALVHFLARGKGSPFASYRLGHIACGERPSSLAMMASMAGQDRFSAFPAAVG